MTTVKLAWFTTWQCNIMCCCLASVALEDFSLSVSCFNTPGWWRGLAPCENECIVSHALSHYFCCSARNMIHLEEMRQVSFLRRSQCVRTEDVFTPIMSNYGVFRSIWTRRDLEYGSLVIIEQEERNTPGSDRTTMHPILWLRYSTKWIE